MVAEQIGDSNPNIFEVVSVQIMIEIPDELASQLKVDSDTFSRQILENLVVEAYKTERITSAEAGRILGLSSRFAVDAFLKEHDAYLHYTEADLEQDIETLQKLRCQHK
jgi:predicted HTH domain antitoxin